jgi:hypothetical protein
VLEEAQVWPDEWFAGRGDGAQATVTPGRYYLRASKGSTAGSSTEFAISNDGQTRRKLYGPLMYV